ncbi:MAG: hypothetical protein V3U15_02190 [Nitrospinota bacterium]
MKDLLLSVIIVVSLILSGCAIAAYVRAIDDMEMSKAAYKKCLEQHPDDLSKCESL